MKKKTKKDNKQASHKASATLDEWIDSELESCRKAFEDGNVGALKDVVYFCGKYQKPLPQWTTSELLILMEDHIRGTGQKKKGRHAKWITQYKQDMIDFRRADCVQECIEHEIQWTYTTKSVAGEYTRFATDVYYVASDLLNGTFAEGTEYAIKKSYDRYKKRSKKDPLRYKMLHTIRTKDVNIPIKLETLEYIHSLRKKNRVTK